MGELRQRWMERALRVHPAVWVIMLAVLLCVPAIAGGLVMDDLSHQRFIHAKLAGQLGDRPWWDMFRLVEADPERLLARRNSGLVPWWTNPELEVAFFRPITVASHFVDHWAWPRRPALMHLHSLALYGVVCGLVVAAFARIGIVKRELGRGGSSSSVATAVLVAGILFAADYSHADPVAWVAQRNSLLTTGFGVACLLAHHRWRAEGSLVFAGLSVATLVASLLSGELGLSTLALLVAYAICIDRGGPGSKLASLAPAMTVVVLWRVAYRWAGFGAHASGAYVDPVRNPEVFFSLLPERLFSLVMMKWGAPARLVWIHHAHPVAFWILFSLGIGAMAAVLAHLVTSVRSDRRVRFWTLGFALCLLPLAASAPGDRLLFFASVPSAAILAGALVRWGPGRWGPHRVAATLIAVVHVVISAVVLFTVCWLQADKSLQGEVFSRGDAIGDDRRLRGQTLVVLNAPSYAHGQMLPLAREAAGLHRPSFTHVLGASDEPVTVTRVDAHTLELHAPSGYLREPFSAFYRGPDAPLTSSDAVETLAFVARPTVVDEQGRPHRVRFRFRRDPSHASLRFVSWNGRDYAPVELPETGQQLRVAGFFALDGD